VAPGLPPAGSFAELGLPVELTGVLAALGVREPFPIQAATLPSALAGRDVLGRARTGSGKTLAFGLALLARTAGRRAEPKRPLALVLVPTRELAQQVSEALALYAQALGLRWATVVGGLAIGRQAASLRMGAEVVVATPGRLADLVARRDCHLDRVRIAVRTRRTRCATWDSCRRSRRSWTGCPPEASGCCSPRRSTATSIIWSGTI
jgi:superfamily II DNA/RNA helicase